MKFLKSLFKVNPIIVKEIRSRMRGGRAFITLTAILVLMGALMYAILQIILANARYNTILSPQIGQALFSALAFLELFMICAVTPAVTAGAISSEKEKQTYEMLMSTPLSPSNILAGKLISALSYVFLLLFAAVPLASIVFIFGGVAIADMVKALLMLFLFAIAYGILGLFMSALFGRTGRATVAAFITVMVLMVGPIFIAGLVGILRGGEPPRWILTPSPISALSATLASSMGRNGLGDFFYILSGLFNMGVAPIDQTSIPRPLYHYTVPFYVVLSLVLYLVSTRLVQPTRRWRIRGKELLVGIGSLVLVVGLIVSGYLLTANRYEWATVQNNQNQGFPVKEPAMIEPMPVPAIEREVIVQDSTMDTQDPNLSPTPTPIPTPTDVLPASAPESSQQSDIYAAIANQFYTVDHTFASAPNWSVLYIIINTDDGVGDPNTPKIDSTTIPAEVQKEVAKRLADLPTKVIWVASRNEVPMDKETGQIDGGQGALITLGNLHPAKNDAILVPASLYFGNLGATGKTYILSNESGSWSIIGTTGAEWIS